MTHYIDTSFAVTAFTQEPATPKVQAWLDAQEQGALAISPWVLAEFSGALSIKVRTGALTLDQRALVLTEWRAFCETGVNILAVTPQDFEAAARIAERHDLALRASDALHLAIASAAGCTLVTLDARMAKAAPELGVPVAAI